ncbi:MAG: NIPSNAP family protein [Limisphaerales bacterium]|jgi:NIPSNAP
MSSSLARREFLVSTVLGSAAVLSGCATSGGSSKGVAAGCYEMRIYHIAPGKQEALMNRFRNHTLKLFARHGITSVGYWMPIDPADQRLHFLLSYPSREAREASWKAFVADPDWQAAYKASEANGPLVSKAENPFYVLTDWSPKPRTGNVSKGGVWEWRTYTANTGRLGALDARFRDHTMALFAKHGIHNYAYWHKMADQPGADITLDYFVTHASVDASKKSFAAFGQDPAWKAAREASEKGAGGSLTAPGGVKSLFLKATDFSPVQ